MVLESKARHLGGELAAELCLHGLGRVFRTPDPQLRCECTVPITNQGRNDKRQRQHTSIYLRAITVLLEFIIQ